MKLESRQKTVLDILVREYVKNAHPVSSDDLITRYKFPFSSATIRNDFKILDKLGYISKPHISAGRVPTDKAYRFYINEHERKNGKKKRTKELSGLSPKNLSDEEFLQSAGAILSEISHSFTTAGLLDDHLFFKHGFAEIMDEPEFENQTTVRDFAGFIDEFEKRVENIFSAISPRVPKVFIGKENPLKEAREYGMIIYAYEKNCGNSAKRRVISILGPKRMDYERNISLLQEFDDIVHEE